MEKTFQMAWEFLLEEENAAGFGIDTPSKTGPVSCGTIDLFGWLIPVDDLELTALLVGGAHNPYNPGHLENFGNMVFACHIRQSQVYLAPIVTVVERSQKEFSKFKLISDLYLLL